MYEYMIIGLLKLQYNWHIKKHLTLK